MSRLTDLIAQAKAKDPELAKELEREFKVLSSRRSFGLNFERHRPESVELPGRPVRKGDKVRVLPPRGEAKKGDQRLWKVKSLSGKGAKRKAKLDLLNGEESEVLEVLADDLVVAAEFKDYIYPGLVSTGKVERGGDKPFHTVINGENFHALEALTFTHRNKIDVIYIDPPYNSGAKDWKYNNDYVDGEDLYHHSKWLAMMERRLKIAKELLNSEDSVLIVTIDEKEYLRLGLLLEQTFPNADMQMISSVISPQGSARPGGFARVEEYIYYLRFGKSLVTSTGDDMLVESEEVVKAPVWFSMIRSGTDARREDSKNLFYPIFISPKSRKVVSVGKPLPLDVKRDSVKIPKDCEAVWPIRRDGSEGRWQLASKTFLESLDKGFAKIGKINNTGSRSVMYVRSGDRDRINKKEIIKSGTDEFGYIIYERTDEGVTKRAPKSIWNKISHDAGKQGSMLVGRMLPNRKFPFPKSLYAVEDALRFFINQKNDAIVLDFFAGSGTTAHAVMRLNKQDGGNRQSISVTNNEVAAEEQKVLLEKKLRPGDPKWEYLGICDYVTKPRIEAAITGKTPEGKKIKGDYKFIDEFAMFEGLKENAEFFTLTYETPIAVSHNKAFAKISPLLWMRAGSEGRRIEKMPSKGWDVADTYGVLTDLDLASDFCAGIEKGDKVRLAFIVTNDDRRFQSVARQLPDAVEPVRLYESYLNNFRFSFGR